MLQGAEESLTHSGRSAPEAELEKELRQAQRAIGRLTMENELYQKNGVDCQTAQEVVAFYRREASDYPVELVCRVMGISRSAFYKALNRPADRPTTKPNPDEQQLVDRIKTLAKRFPDYGYRRIWALLRFGDDPIVINRKRVQRLMQIHGLQVKVKRHQAARRPHMGRVEVNASDLLWGIDMTKIWCGQDGWASLFAIVDHCDRECVGYRFSLNAKAERAREALDEAVAYRFNWPQAVPHDCKSGPITGPSLVPGHFSRKSIGSVWS